MRKSLILICIIIVAIIIAYKNNFFISSKSVKHPTVSKIPIPLPTFSKPAERTWDIQSIDTMKYSRDTARAKLKDLSFLNVIDSQVKNIAETGATHIAIGTPYDQEFYPMLEKWVSATRKYNLHVWFRGNWCGWEGWFDYPKNLSQEGHIKKTKDFILNYPDIFQDGDIFSACPECENGGAGDPRKTGDTEGFRKFIISEYQSNREAFDKIGKKVSANYYPMNGDVAKLVMDKETTKALDGIVVVDHYVKSPEKLAKDLIDLQATTGGKIILGEFGAPIPDIHGKMTESQQAKWNDDVLKKVSAISGIGGVNYWVNAGGTTGIWDKNGKAFSSVAILKKYFKAKNVFGIVTDNLNRPIEGAKISFLDREVVSQENGYFEIRFVENFPLKITVKSSEFLSKNVEIEENNNQLQIILDKK